jgi:hypothetical protein
MQRQGGGRRCGSKHVDKIATLRGRSRRVGWLGR